MNGIPSVLSLQSYKTLIYKGFAKKKEVRKLEIQTKYCWKFFEEGFWLDLDV